MLFGIAVDTKTPGLRRIGFAESPFQALLSTMASVHGGAHLTSNLVICYPGDTQWMYEVDLYRVLRVFGLRIADHYQELFSELDDNLRRLISDTTAAFQQYLIGFDTMQKYGSISNRLQDALVVWAKPHDGTSNSHRFGNICELFRVALDEGLEAPVQATLTAQVLYDLGYSIQGEMILQELILAQYPELEGKLE